MYQSWNQDQFQKFLSELEPKTELNSKLLRRQVGAASISRFSDFNERD